jgi:hypothetical protein
MAQPTPYARQFNFDDHQTVNPTTPLPAVQIDNELNSARTNLTGLNTNIGLIQRDDGKLANQSVHANSLGVDTLALIGLEGYTVQGNWTAGRAYAAGDLVDNNAATYLAVTAHTSGNVFDTDLAADKWILLANAAITTTASTVDKFEGTGSQTTFTLSFSYTSNTDVLVFVNGALRNPGDDYTISGNQITFSTAPGTPAVSGNENVIIWGPSVTATAAVSAAQAAASTAQGHSNDAQGHVTTAQQYAVKIDGVIPTTSEYSSKAWANGGTGVTGATGGGAAIQWAIGGGATPNTSTTVDGTEFSAKAYAVSSINRGSTGAHSAKDWASYYVDGTETVDGTNKSAKAYAIEAQNAVATFDQVYYGAHADDTAAQNAHTSAGHTVAPGDLYFNTTDSNLKFYDGTQWNNVAAVNTSSFATKGFVIAMAAAL